MVMVRPLWFKLLSQSSSQVEKLIQNAGFFIYFFLFLFFSLSHWGKLFLTGITSLVVIMNEILQSNKNH